MQAVYPRIQRLKLSNANKFQGIWMKPVPVESFNELSELELHACGDLVHVMPSNMLPNF